MFEPRSYQVDVIKALDNGARRLFLLNHRRSGKDVICWNIMVREAFKRVGTYLYIFPTASLGRRIIWQGAIKDGKRFMSFIPDELIKRKNEQNLTIELVNGSIIQIVGSDRFINVGINPIMCIFSEFSLQNGLCWDYIRPILIENGGIALFNTTPRGVNFAKDLWDMACNNPEWYTQKLTIHDTGVMTDEDVAREINAGMSETLARQEFFCDFDVGQEGSYYAKLFATAEKENRICAVPVDPHARVDTFWDLGVSDSTSIIFAQKIGKEVHIVDYYEDQGEGLDYYAKVLRDKDYLYGEHYAPHDIMVRELGSGAKTRLEIARSLGISFKIVPNIGIYQGIELVRGIFPNIFFDKTKTSYLARCIVNYRKEYNQRLKTFSDRPLHDFSSHACDALRYMAVTYDRNSSVSKSNFSEFNERLRKTI